MHTIVRSAVAALALTGSAAYAHNLSSPSAKTNVVTTIFRATPPMCPPSNPGPCMNPSTK